MQQVGRPLFPSDWASPHKLSPSGGNVRPNTLLRLKKPLASRDTTCVRMCLVLFPLLNKVAICITSDNQEAVA